MPIETLPRPGQTDDPKIIDKIPDNIMYPSDTGNSLAIPQYESPDDDTGDGLWEYTVKAKDRFGDFYQGRRLIARDSPIDGGVYMGTYGGEAIVVDSEKYPDQYQKLLDEVLERSKVDGEVHRSRVLGAVFDVVSEKMEYSQPGVDGLVGRFADGQKVDLSVFLEAGVGVCRHQALAAALLLEKMQEMGYIRGRASIDRNMEWNPKGEREGHAWVRYTGGNGEVAILDVAQQKLIHLQDVDPNKGWNYLRPEERNYLERHSS